jgi:glycine hydroxymethyltransferase
VTSGVRVGTAAVTPRGFKEDKLKEVGQIIALVLKDVKNEAVKEEARKRLQTLNDCSLLDK